MKLKPFLQLIYGLAGLLIALFTAIMTYLIIGEPIGMKMTSQIALTILATLPMIAIVSYMIGSYLSKKFQSIASLLDAIDANKFVASLQKDQVVEISEIYTSIFHLSRRLQESVEQLQKHNQDLHTVIQTLSHDIKTPLTIIDGYLDEFEDGLVSQAQVPRVIQTLKKETAYLKELSMEIIAYIQSQQRGQSPREEIFLKEFLHQEVCPLLRVSEEVKLQCKIDEEDTLIFHPTSLKQILINLLHNASKYTKKGSITVSYKQGMVLVTDSGIGIQSEDQEEIFKPFVSLDASRSRETNGFGLGLSIASNLANNNGYTLSLDTSYTQGCQFILAKSEVFESL